MSRASKAQAKLLAGLWGERDYGRKSQTRDENPWVAAYSFRAIRANIDAPEVPHG